MGLSCRRNAAGVSEPLRPRNRLRGIVSACVPATREEDSKSIRRRGPVFGMRRLRGSRCEWTEAGCRAFSLLFTLALRLRRLSRAAGNGILRGLEKGSPGEGSVGSKFENIREVRRTDADGSCAAERAAACAALRQAFGGCTLAFFGLAVVRIWIQCNLYGNYVLSDAGLVSVVINFVRIAFTVLLVAFALRGLLGRRFAKALEWFSVTAMTLGSVLFFLNGTLASDAVLYAACTCAGLGIVWGGGMWMAFYLRLRPRTALLCALGSLALGSLGGFVMGALPRSTCYLVGVFLPTVSYVCFGRSMRVADERGWSQAPGGVSSSRECPEFAIASKAYGAESRVDFLRLLAGLALFMLAMGVSRGFPFGESIALPLGMQLLHQGGVVVLCGVWAWAALCRGRAVSSATLWRFEVVAASAGVVLMATLEWWGLAGGAALVSIANTMTLGILWVICYDIARHSPWNPYAVLGVCWAVFLLAREVGRWGILVFAPQSSVMTLLAALMVCVLSISIAVLLGDNVPRARPLLTGFPGEEAGEGGAASEGDAGPAGCGVTASVVGRAGVAVGGEGDAVEPPIAGRREVLMEGGAGPGLVGDVAKLEREPEVVLHAADDGRIARLIAGFGLTRREAEVALMLAEGKSKVAIAELLVLSENTVRSYAKNAYMKMDVHSKRELQQTIREMR